MNLSCLKDERDSCDTCDTCGKGAKTTVATVAKCRAISANCRAGFRRGRGTITKGFPGGVLSADNGAAPQTASQSPQYFAAVGMKVP